MSPPLDRERILESLKAFDFRNGKSPLEALDFAADQLERYQVHAPHPCYFGLFNPAPTAMGIAADTLVAAFNPQLAAWSHNPFASEVEAHLIRAMGARFGYDPQTADGVFTAGGAEANHTALLTALASRFPEFREHGIHGLARKPSFYLSVDGHDSMIKAARLCGLGTEAARRIPVAGDLKIDPRALAGAIESDRRSGRAPFLVVATAGSTGAGIVDPHEPIAEICARENLWFHSDAAYGGAAVLLDELKDEYRGIGRADSITFDTHKWLSIPMAAGMYLTRHSNALIDTFRVAADYMPQDASGMQVTDPFTHSIQWSRRFIGLKVFLSLAVHGWKGYETIIRRQVALGNYLRECLRSAEWTIVNDTPLPVVCFVDSFRSESAGFAAEIVRRVIASGKAWISTALLGGEKTAIRACINNFRTSREDVETLVEALNKAREETETARN
ncbi:MAG: pyridoxal-dependent decarboxylase [Candidatus Aminicenantes bacterium]|nr:pyridoxal-dependent decarboxylase [Candidatus Aminicenantes bacterium]